MVNGGFWQQPVKYFRAKRKTEVKMNSDIQQLFTNYEHAFSALDVARQADLFADSFLSAGPRGVIANSKAQFT
jgi:hypothetical protein